MSNTFATLPVMAGDDVPARPRRPDFQPSAQRPHHLMGEEVKDDMANRICAQLLMLAAEDPKKDIWLYINFAGWLHHRRYGHLRQPCSLIEPDVATVAWVMCASMGQFPAELRQASVT